MNPVDAHLNELYQAPRDGQAQATAARYAPVLYFDANEPFLPLAAGYTLFTRDGPSPSFERMIELRPDGEPAAALAIEYAIWWDWDIHHLYELEHVWVYVDAQGQPVRVEGSWHGKFYRLPLQLENGRAVLLSEPGKHAFALDPAWFHQRIRDFRRSETRAVSLHAHVLINQLFHGKIRRNVFDRVLVRSFLMGQAFTPTWNFSKRFSFEPNWLMPWADLQRWIPERVNAVLAHLEQVTPPSSYRALRLVSAQSTLAGLQAAASSGADAIITPLSLVNNRLALGIDGDPGEQLDLDEAVEFCKHEPMGAFLGVSDPAVIERLAWYVRSNQLNQYVVVFSAEASHLAQYRSFVPDGMTAIQLQYPDQDPLHAAKQSGAVFIGLPGGQQDLSPAWIERVHNAGPGIISSPIETQAERDTLQHLGLDVIWEKRRIDESHR